MFVSKDDRSKWPARREFDRSSPRSGSQTKGDAERKTWKNGNNDNNNDDDDDDDDDDDEAAAAAAAAAAAVRVVNFK